MFKYFILTSIFTWLVSCQTTTDRAGGTASEGESFVYGVVIDSSEITGSLRKILAANGNAQITIAEYTLGESGYVSTWSIQSESNDTGYFRISLPSSGTYTLVASNGLGARATLGNFVFNGDSLNLGTIGMHKPILLNGNVSPLPNCTKGAQVALVGGMTVPLDSSGAFQFDQASPGNNILALQCDELLAEWEINLPGHCSSVSLQDLPWTSGKITVDGNCQANHANKANSGVGN